MVSTRKKDYGSAPPPTRRPPRQPKKPFSEFTLFPRLPLELQLMIWQASMTPRLIVLAPKGIKTAISQQSRRALPSLFSVNQGSRYCALRRYTIRLTLSLTVDETGKHAWSSPEFQSTTHQANVVMCADDTLGFMGWETLDFKHGTRFEVKGANGSPWTSFPKNTGGVKKVAFLGPGFAQNNKIVDDLNSVVSWDLRSILHKETARGKLREWYPNKDTGLWSLSQHPPWFKRVRTLLIQSRCFDGNLQSWARRLIHRAKKGTLPLWTGAPDILAFKLRKKPKRITFPHPYIPAATVHDLYRALPYSMVWDLLDDFYASMDWRWDHRHDRDRRGF